MTKEEFILHVGFLKVSTTTVDCGNHFDDLRILIKRLSEEKLEFDIRDNKSFFIKMLKLEHNWDAAAKKQHKLLHEQLVENI